uniref:rRNA methyltransferase n=1 Tax=Ananas comosus var. bracteatus TaxID=296719 RepID=A0A6V7NZ77_ANACO|nr:unnamed protein product [Ananas comosus var. bracteatus]
MGKAKGKQRKDKYYHLAREKGYRSRAAFKLLQLDASYRFLSTARSVLDLCAAPGGWLQVAVAHAPVGALVVGVDLCPIRPVRGALALAEDITTQRCRAEIQRVMNQRGCAAFDVVLHDGSPNVGGAWAQEATSQSALVVDAVRLATAFLVPRAPSSPKSQDYSAIIYCLKQLFEKVEATKPVASRSTSAEIYVICQKYKAPAKIDPRLLDVKYLFQGAFERPKVVDVLHGSKQKRNREGYEDGNTTLWKVGLASDFVWSETPLEFLGSFNAISFEDPACLSIKNHELTTDEVKSLCEDLYVIDKNSFKHLLKWRLKLRKALSSAQKIGRKREQKLLAKRRAKDKARKAFGQIDATEDSYFDRELFSLSSIKGKKELQAVESNELSEKEDADRNLGDSDSEEADAVADGDSPEEVDTDEEQQRYNDQLEDMLDEAYERYLNRKGGGTKQYKRAKRIDPNADEDLLEGGEEDDNLIEADHDADQDQEKELNPL